MEPLEIVISEEMIGLLDHVNGQDLLRHGLSEWELELFKVVTNKSLVGIKYFVARLYKSTPEANLERILVPIQQALGDIRQLNFGNISIKLASSFKNFITVSGPYNNNTYRC